MREIRLTYLGFSRLCNVFTGVGTTAKGSLFAFSGGRFSADRSPLNSTRLDNVSPTRSLFSSFSLSAVVSTKALAGAKTLGGFLYSAVNKAGKTVVEAGVKIKKTVEENVSYIDVLRYIFSSAISF